MEKQLDSFLDTPSEGAQKDFSESKGCTMPEEAHSLFRRTKARLLDVNHWHEYSDTPARFVLTDENGEEVARAPKEGDYFKIDIPGIGSKAGDGYDWVQIEAIEEDEDAHGDQEYIAIRVRPAANPTKKEEGVAHFLSDQATSCFIVKREGIHVTAEIHGRNEKPNHDTEHLVDTVRNTVVAAGAILGFANIQWNRLVKGLLSEECY